MTCSVPFGAHHNKLPVDKDRSKLIKLNNHTNQEYVITRGNTAEMITTVPAVIKKRLLKDNSAEALAQERNHDRVFSPFLQGLYCI